MSLAGLVERFGRAIVLTVVLVTIAGVVAGLAPAQQHLSAARIPARGRSSATAARCPRAR